MDGAPTGKPDARDRIGAQQRAQGGEDGHACRDDQAVAERLAEHRPAVEEVRIEVCRRMLRNHVRSGEQVQPALEGPDDNDQREGQQQHGHHDERQQTRHHPRPQVQAQAVEAAPE